MVEVTKLRPAVVLGGDILEGRYRIIEPLARGGMGTVFLAEHVLIGRRVALKVLHPELALQQEVVEHFMDEALAAGTLGHPNIVESTDMGFTAGGVPFIVFEYLEGSLLSEEINRVGRMSLRRTLNIARQIASALVAAHDAGIVHLDLKGDNVFVTDREGTPDHVKIVDFGISQFTGSPTQQLIMGTPESMAPEQVTDPGHVDCRADIYALGVLMYELLTARRPFVNEDVRVVLYRIQHEVPPPLGQPELSPEIEGFVEQLLEKDPARRPQTMREVEVRLEQLAMEQRSRGTLPDLARPVPVILAHAPTAIQEHGERGTAHRRPVFLALGALAILSGLALRFAEARSATSTAGATLTTLQSDAARLAASLVAQARSTQLRADAIASSPVLRAAIVTDAATIADLALTEALVATQPGETIEIFQLADDKLDSAVRLPNDAKPIRPTLTGEMRLEAIAGGLQTIAFAPVQHRSHERGVVAIATRVDLAGWRTQFAEDALAVRLTGLADSIELVTGSAPGLQLDVAVPIDPALRSPPLTIAATVRVVQGGRTFRRASQVAFGAGALLLLAFGVLKSRQ